MIILIIHIVYVIATRTKRFFGFCKHCATTAPHLNTKYKHNREKKSIQSMTGINSFGSGSWSEFKCVVMIMCQYHLAFS